MLKSAVHARPALSHWATSPAHYFGFQDFIDLDKSHKHNTKQKQPDPKHLSFHLYKERKQARVIFDAETQDQGSLGEGEDKGWGHTVMVSNSLDRVGTKAQSTSSYQAAHALLPVLALVTQVCVLSNNMHVHNRCIFPVWITCMVVPQFRNLNSFHDSSCKPNWTRWESNFSRRSTMNLNH